VLWPVGGRSSIKSFVSTELSLSFLFLHAKPAGRDRSFFVQGSDALSQSLAWNNLSNKTRYKAIYVWCSLCLLALPASNFPSVVVAECWVGAPDDDLRITKKHACSCIGDRFSKPQFQTAAASSFRGFFQRRIVWTRVPAGCQQASALWKVRTYVLELSFCPQ
jgi:hypothetical protein